MEKITPQRAITLSKKLDRPIGDSNPFYLASNCFVEMRNGEEIVFDKDVTDGAIKPLFLPKKEENFLGQSISIATPEDINLLEKQGFIFEKEFYGDEYIYRTKDIISLEGSHYKNFRKEITYFKRSFKYKLLKTYDKNKILLFLKKWEKEKESKELTEDTKRNFKFELAANLSWIGLLDKIPHKKIFVEIGGNLVGFDISVKLHKDLWVGLIQKTDHKYRGLRKFLNNIEAKEWKDLEFFTTGNPGDDQGLIKSKESLRPFKKIPTYVLRNIRKKK